MIRRSFAMPKGWWLIPGCLVLVAVVYAFLASSGTFTRWPTYTTSYDLQAEGFRHGRLNLAASPSSELLAKANPYDRAYRDLWLWDISLFKGKYYLYWGPLPAIAQAIVKSILGIHGLIGDQYLVFGFFWLSAAFGALILDRMARLLDVPRYLLALGILAFALSNPAPYLVGTAGVYQAAIAGGQACLLGGLALAFYAVWHAESGGTPRVALTMAGLAWSLALASRVSLAPAVALLLITTAVATRRPHVRAWKRFLGDALCLGIPVVLVCMALLLYNKARFDSWFETGVTKQLTTMPFKFSLKYLNINAYSYLLRPYESSCRFPFALEYWDLASRGIPDEMAIPDGYLLEEPVVGLMRVVPCTWLLPVPIGVALWTVWSRVRSRGISRRDDPLPNHPRVYTWCAVSFGIAGSVTGLADLGLYMATMRYLADVTFGLVLLGLLGAWTLRMRVSWNRWTRAVAGAVCVGLCVPSIIFGVLLGYQGYSLNFQRHNPKLSDKIVDALSVCKTRM